MPPLSTKSLGRLVAGFWIFNLLAATFLVAAWLIPTNPSIYAFFVRSTPLPTGTPTSSQTPFPTSTYTLSASETPIKTGTPTQTTPPTPTQPETLTTISFSEEPIVIGYSVEKRPLEVYRFGTGKTERLIVAGIHGGNEYNTVQLADLLITYLQANPGIVPAGETLFILKDLNPDGVARGLNDLGRANAHGVDLNRNWDANWKKDWPRDGCWIQTDVTGGTAPISEPETKALAAFIQDQNIDALISYHSAALGIFPGGLPPGDASIHLAEAVAAVTTYPYPPINTGCVYTGDFTDWADKKGIAALNIELTDHSHTDLEMNLKVLNVFLNWKR
jgi:murein peptide amidase A